jgi:DNA polymerase III subunit beta
MEGKKVKFTIGRDELLSALSSAQSILGNSQIIPILGCVLIRAGDELSITATNLEITIKRDVKADISKSGSTCINCAHIFSVVRALQKGEVDCELSGSDFIIKSGRARFKIKALSPDDFPQMEINSSAASYSYSADEFSGLISRVKHAASISDKDYGLRGVFMGVRDGRVVSCSLDLKRLASCSIDATPDMQDCIIPIELANCIEREIDGQIDVFVDGRKMMIKSSSLEITGKMIEYEFPDFEKLHQSCLSNPHRVIVRRGDFLDAVNRVAVASEKNYRAIKLSIGKEKVTISSRDLMDATEELPCYYEGDDLEVGISSAFLAQCLESLSTDDVEILFSTGIGSHLFNGKEHDWSIVCGMRVRTTRNL